MLFNFFFTLNPLFIGNWIAYMNVLHQQSMYNSFKFTFMLTKSHCLTCKCNCFGFDRKMLLNKSMRFYQRKLLYFYFKLKVCGRWHLLLQLNQAGLLLGFSTILLSLSCWLGVSPSYSTMVSTAGAFSGPPSITWICWRIKVVSLRTLA